MWDDYYLKFADEVEYGAHMPAEWQVPASAAHAVDVVGTLYRTDTYAALEGFHVNLRLVAGMILPEVLAPFALPEPEMPKRVFA